MALQGDLNSFALPDVLRLLAGTSKSGCLDVEGPGVHGEVVLRKGIISSAKVSNTPHAGEPADVVFELLRLDGGTFNFDEGEVADKGVVADVEITIAAAESLVAEWTEIEAVIPSMEAWLTLAPEIDGHEVTLSAGQWRALAAIGGGGNVHDLAAALDLTDLVASRQVVDLVEAQLVTVRASAGYTVPEVELDDFEQFEQFEQFEGQIDDPMTEFEDLVAEDRPVVMEEREDALLPEPLPGEGVAYEGEAITGSVDGRAFDTTDETDSDMPEATETVDAFEAFESLASFEAEVAESDRIGEPGTIEDFGDADPFPLSGEGDEASEPVAETSDDRDFDAEDDSGVVMELAGAPAVDAPNDEVDEERDSLLKFLSSVKP